MQLREIGQNVIHRTGLRIDRRALAALAALGIMVVVAGVASPKFPTDTNFSNVMRQAVALGLVSIGQTFVMVTGGFDLSVASTISLVSVLAAGAMADRPDWAWLLILLLLPLSLIIGWVNGLLVTRLRLHPFIATFGTMSILQGLTFLYTTKPTGKVTQEFREIARAQVGLLPVGIVAVFVLVVLAFWVLRYTRFGRQVYAVGGNQEIARLSGIRMNMILVSVYAISGACAFLASMFLTSRTGIGSPVVGVTYAFDSVTAVVLGGTPLTGGRGGIVGTLFGVFLLILINNVLNLLGVAAYWQYVLKAVILIGAVAIQRD